MHYHCKVICTTLSILVHVHNAFDHCIMDNFQINFDLVDLIVFCIVRKFKSCIQKALWYSIQPEDVNRVHNIAPKKDIKIAKKFRYIGR